MMNFLLRNFLYELIKCLTAVRPVWAEAGKSAKGKCHLHTTRDELLLMYVIINRILYSKSTRQTDKISHTLGHLPQRRGAASIQYWLRFPLISFTSCRSVTKVESSGLVSKFWFLLLFLYPMLSSVLCCDPVFLQSLRL